MICPLTREQMNTIAIPDRGGFRFVTDWQALAADDGAAIRSFWQRNSVMTDEIQISACLTEVVAHALTDTRSSESPHNPARASNGFLYAGKNSRGVDLRVWYFRGVPVKSRVQPTVTP